MKELKIIALGIVAICCSCNSKENRITEPLDPKSRWVDSIYSQMTLEEKVGQLFMVATYSNRNADHIDSIQKLIEDQHIGGLIFFQGGPVRQATITNRCQSISKIPLMIAIDAEWGLNMRLDSTVRYPFNMTLGAVNNNDLIKHIGKQIGYQHRRMGIHVNYAPVVDINTNPDNPVIGVRSYGEDRLNVSNKAMAFIEGMQSEGVLSCAKHFPGHGDTATDSHYSLPTISFSEERIDSIELYPYKQLINKGIASVMVAHLNVPALESKAGLPSSLSYNIISNILKEKLNFKGLIFTDALNMKAASNYMEPGEIELAAFNAGNDVLLFSENSQKAISKIIKAYRSKEITEERLAHSVKKFLSAKYDVKLHQFQPIEIANLIQDLNKIENLELINQVLSSAITVIKNDGLLPLIKGEHQKIAYLKLGDGTSDIFTQNLKGVLDIEMISNLPKNQLLEKLEKFDLVIIGYHRSNYRITHDISKNDLDVIQRISNQNKVILDVFASQYSLKKLDMSNIETAIISYENSEVAQELSAKIILGNIKPVGKLPASINKEYLVNHGL